MRQETEAETGQALADRVPDHQAERNHRNDEGEVHRDRRQIVDERTTTMNLPLVVRRPARRRRGHLTSPCRTAERWMTVRATTLTASVITNRTKPVAMSAERRFLPASPK